MSSHFRWLIVIIVLTAFALWVAVPDTGISNLADYCEPEQLAKYSQAEGIHLDTNNDCEPDINLNVHQSFGLDIVGGLRVLLEAELPTSEFSLQDLQETANNVARRVNGLGLTEATIQVQGNHRILVELPGVTDREQAINTIQQTALLEFVDMSSLGRYVDEWIGQKILTNEQVLIYQQRQSLGGPEATPEATPDVTPEPSSDATAGTDVASDQPTGIVNPLTNQPFVTVITGSGLKAAVAQHDAKTGTPYWYIQFELEPDAVDAFSNFTRTASQTQEPLGIILDGVLLSAPRVQAQLTTGGVITGSFTEEEAKQLALQLRSGALPIPLRVESAQEVGATLGQESINLSVRAGIIGVIVVLSFMFIYYRVPGIAADFALVVFIILNLAVFKLIPVTLTLPAITGFLISIGTAVDGNILIFERIKEELRDGKPLDQALESGFDRAWNSIRDSNLSTIIISFILFMFGQTPGASIVSGFALTLGIGLVLNLFTAVIVTRTFLHILVAIMRGVLTQRQWLLGV